MRIGLSSFQFAAVLVVMVWTTIWMQIASAPSLWLVAACLLLTGIGLRRVSRFQAFGQAALTAAALVLGYRLYRMLGEAVRQVIGGDDALGIAISRLSLVALIVPVAILFYVQRGRPRYVAWGNWRSTVRFPWILRGNLREDPVWIILIGFAVAVSIVLAFIVDWGQDGLGRLAVYAVLFAAINSVLEELLWRGYILSRFASDFGGLRGLILAGASFGFYHLHLGFSWAVCVLFAFFGMMMGAVAIRTQGLAPVTVMHGLMNVGFAFAGMIF